jgi:hypothetical protein
MARDGMRQWIAQWNVLPIKMNSRDLNLLDFNQELVSGQTVANLVMKDCDDGELDYKYASNKPATSSTREIAESQGEQCSQNECYSSRCPVLAADFVEEVGSAFQPRDLFLELHQTSHVRLTITVSL